MATICGEITADQSKDCSAPLTVGNEGTLYIANRNDIASYVRDVNNPQIVRGITMKTGKQFFKYEGHRSSTLKPRWTGVRKSFGSGFKHELDAVIFNYSSAVKQEVKALADGTFVAIVINKAKGNDAAIEIYGTDVGMILKDGMIRDLNSADFEAYIPFGLESEEGQEEPFPPASFAVLDGAAYSYTDTLEALELLTLPAV